MRICRFRATLPPSLAHELPSKMTCLLVLEAMQQQQEGKRGLWLQKYLAPPLPLPLPLPLSPRQQRRRRRNLALILAPLVLQLPTIRAETPTGGEKPKRKQKHKPKPDDLEVGTFAAPLPLQVLDGTVAV
mmetsp:Transcript_2728/g.6605  ORF Transcript_2728/g.6605 Transcript_2728/m.6605 type:complete len:130 (+) Transcript_2728:255-644(+)